MSQLPLPLGENPQSDAAAALDHAPLQGVRLPEPPLGNTGHRRLGWGMVQKHAVLNVLYVLTMVAIIVGVDILFFRNHFWARLIANVGIVLVFGAFYFRFLRGS